MTQYIEEARKPTPEHIAEARRVREGSHSCGEWFLEETHVMAIAAAIAAAEERGRPQWQTIDTAPMDGTEIIGCYVNDYGYQDKPTVYGPWTMKWDGREWVSSWDGWRVVDATSDFGTSYRDLDIDPTHWMPSPVPPAITKEPTP